MCTFAVVAADSGRAIYRIAECWSVCTDTRLTVRSYCVPTGYDAASICQIGAEFSVEFAVYVFKVKAFNFVHGLFPLYESGKLLRNGSIYWQEVIS